MAEHTPTPWEAQDFDDEENGVAIIGLRTNNGIPYDSPTNGMVAWATLHPTEAEAGDATRAKANAAFIVKAANSHEALVAALQEISGPRFTLELDQGDNEIGSDARDYLDAIQEIAREALALCKKKD